MMTIIIIILFHSEIKLFINSKTNNAIDFDVGLLCWQPATYALYGLDWAMFNVPPNTV